MGKQPSTVAIILAAGKGTRFQSDIPKVLQPIHQKPMLHYVIESVITAGVSTVCLVVGYNHEKVRESCRNFDVLYAYQPDQLGTGHAVMCGVKTVTSLAPQTSLILAGDCPLIQPQTLQRVLAHHHDSAASATVVTAMLPDAGSYGRIIRNTNQDLVAIREARDCSPQELAIREFNSGIYSLDTLDLQTSLDGLTTANNQSEYYLTDVIGLLSRRQKRITSVCIDNPDEVRGANTPAELALLANLFPFS
jgi:UDP-N-acetylglucosamine diphosphorylase/glucosamine-1-phosphate N-acetyltransferase